MENQYSTKAKQESNCDRYTAFGFFPSSVFAGLKQNTQFYGGTTILFDRTEPKTGFIIGDGRKGLVLTSKEFYSGVSLEILLDTDYLPKWISDGFDGFGTWYDPTSENIKIDPVDMRFYLQAAHVLGYATPSTLQATCWVAYRDNFGGRPTYTPTDVPF